MSSLPFAPDTIFTVTSLTNIIKAAVENISPGAIKLEGEISNYRPSSSGHVYFTLKDASSQISAVMFRSAAVKLSFIPQDGMKVCCTGKLTVYAARGNYQIVISFMEPSGTGDILQMLEERKKKLAAEGLFDTSKKRPLPLFPQRIGVVTSPTGAALRDILQIAKRRNDSISIIILPALVQGESAAKSIARQIRTANEYKMCDTLIVGRGGGSLEDLLPFSDEEVVRAVAASEIPIVSAVGHEIDWALCDYAASIRAPTPSAAAELVIPQKSDILNDIQGFKEELKAAVQNKIEHIRLILRSYSLDGMELQLRNIEQPLLARFDAAKAALISNMEQKIKDVKIFIENCVNTMEGASPKTIFARGYAMVRNKQTQKIIRSGNDTALGQEIEIVPAQGYITAEVTAIKNG
ncbi:exodeoxyribonuclease VII large subunit [Treponema parvum]|uniref:Exodeoxyribonuclease 7 large subunit n=1 Tax=Treponema parvum TaxID=138851 RepID=A0A975ICJ1_9SPIR|nr:exodeoxyribonuclease VII large subunit [Treponema parvum]QTQ11955.1 exodeoxyribonuclease VII large subunit [Treponema parvum]QTQ16067.1 exodeoxyribonuclease VII large subunit [Treponema parvum]